MSRSGFVYLAVGGTYTKIGCSSNPVNRVTAFAGLPFTVELVHQIKTNDKRWLERLLLDRFAVQRVGGEWFTLTHEDIAWICAIPEWNTSEKRQELAKSGGRPGSARRCAAIARLHRLADSREATWQAIEKHAAEEGLHIGEFIFDACREKVERFRRQFLGIKTPLSDRLPGTDT